MTRVQERHIWHSCHMGARVFLDDLPPPALLVRLVRTGKWPSARGHNGVTYGDDHALRALTGEVTVCFLPPPFASIARRVRVEDFWTWPCASPHEIDFEKTVVIADFCLGSDSPIVLDYSGSRTTPRVLWLRWLAAPPGEPRGGESRHNRWSELSKTFDDFGALLGLA
jgi:hypothetical protein